MDEGSGALAAAFIVGAAGAVFDPEVGVIAGQGEGDAGEADPVGGVVEVEGAVCGAEVGGAAVAELEPLVAGGGGEGGGGDLVEYVLHAGREALLELEFVLAWGEGGVVDGEGERGREGGAGLLEPGVIDGVLAGAWLCGDRGRPAAQERKHEGCGERGETAHMPRIHRGVSDGGEGGGRSR